MNAARMSIREVLEQVKPGGAANEKATAVLSETGAESGEHRPPWFVRALIAVSAWISSILLLLFLFGTELIQSSGGAIALGALIIAGAVVLRRIRGNVPFLAQLSLALSLAGQALLLFGMGNKLRSVGGVSLVAVCLSVVLIIVYPDRVHRFLSTVVAIGAACALVYTYHLAYGFQVLAVVLAGAAGHVLYNESRLAGFDAILRPVGYGMLAGTFFLLVPSIVPPEFRMHYGLAQNWLPATVALTALLAFFEFRVLLFHRASGNLRVASFLGLGTICLAIATVKAPGIIAALYMLALGFHRANRLVMGISLAFLTVFVSGFYYNLDITLLNKSYILLGAGGVLIVFRLFLVLGNPEAAHE